MSNFNPELYHNFPEKYLTPNKEVLNREIKLYKGLPDMDTGKRVNQNRTLSEDDLKRIVDENFAYRQDTQNQFEATIASIKRKAEARKRLLEDAQSTAALAWRLSEITGTTSVRKLTSALLDANPDKW